MCPRRATTRHLGHTRQHSKPSYTVRPDGRVQTDPYRNKLYSKQQYQINGSKIVPDDTLKQYSKPILVIESEKRN